MKKILFISIVIISNFFFITNIAFTQGNNLQDKETFEDWLSGQANLDGIPLSILKKYYDDDSHIDKINILTENIKERKALIIKRREIMNEEDGSYDQVKVQELTEGIKKHTDRIKLFGDSINKGLEESWQTEREKEAKAREGLSENDLAEGLQAMRLHVDDLLRSEKNKCGKELKGIVLKQFKRFDRIVTELQYIEINISIIEEEITSGNVRSICDPKLPELEASYNTLKANSTGKSGIERFEKNNGKQRLAMLLELGPYIGKLEAKDKVKSAINSAPDPCLEFIESNKEDFKKYEILLEKLDDRTKLAKQRFKKIELWVSENPCDAEKKTAQKDKVDKEEEKVEPEDEKEDEPVVIKQKRCPSDRMIKDDKGNCVCDSEKYIPDPNDPNNCLSLEELEQEAAEDSEDDTFDCAKFDERLLEMSTSYSKTINPITLRFTEHERTALRIFDDSKLAGVNPCGNTSLVRSFKVAKDANNDLNTEKLYLELDIARMYAIGQSCRDELWAFLRKMEVLMQNITEVEERYKSLLGRWNENNCKEEDEDNGIPWHAQDPDRNPIGDLVGGAGTEIPGDNIDNDNDGLIDEAPDEGSVVEEPIDKVRYVAVRMSGSGYRRNWAGHADKITGESYHVWRVPAGQPIQDRLNEIIAGIREGSERACASKQPALCPCAPWPDFWNSAGPSFDFLEYSESRSELENKYRCENTTFHGQSGYICFRYDYENITWNDLPAECR